MSDPICTCKQYNVECDDQCNCCDSPYAIEGCDCECYDRKTTQTAKILGELIKGGILEQIARARGERPGCGGLPEKGVTIRAEKKTFVGTERATVRVDELNKKLAEGQVRVCVCGNTEEGYIRDMQEQGETTPDLSGKPRSWTEFSADIPYENQPTAYIMDDERNEETEWGQEDGEPLTDLQQRFVDELDKGDAARESTIAAGQGHTPTLRIRKRSNPEILEYMASNIEKQADYYNQHQLVILLRMVADKIKEDNDDPDPRKD